MENLESPVWGVIGVVVGIFSLLVTTGISIYLYRRSQEKKEPVLYYRTFRDIQKVSLNNSNIAILYKGNEVNRIYTTYVFLWNRGRRTIVKEDLRHGHLKLQLVDDDYPPDILDYQLVKQSRNECAIEILSKNEGSLNFQFDFLDPNDGVAIEIQHTGSFDSKITVEGIILGAPQGVKIIPPTEQIVLGLGVEPKLRRFVQTSIRDRFVRIFRSLGIIIAFVAVFILSAPLLENLTPPDEFQTSSDIIRDEVANYIPSISNERLTAMIMRIQNRRAELNAPTPLEQLLIGTGILIFLALYAYVIIVLVWRRENYPFPTSLNFAADE